MNETEYRRRWIAIAAGVVVVLVFLIIIWLLYHYHTYENEVENFCELPSQCREARRAGHQEAKKMTELVVEYLNNYPGDQIPESHQGNFIVVENDAGRINSSTVSWISKPELRGLQIKQLPEYYKYLLQHAFRCAGHYRHSFCYDTAGTDGDRKITNGYVSFTKDNQYLVVTTWRIEAQFQD